MASIVSQHRKDELVQIIWRQEAQKPEEIEHNVDFIQLNEINLGLEALIGRIKEFGENVKWYHFCIPCSVSMLARKWKKLGEEMDEEISQMKLKYPDVANRLNWSFVRPRNPTFKGSRTIKDRQLRDAFFTFNRLINHFQWDTMKVRRRAAGNSDKYEY